ncbi:MAG: DUF1194 domain-containing protein [Gammaproteobacteria bacterium]|nr:DUF1194 domain-containing protein [Gammaproteobacteria bacterium]
MQQAVGIGQRDVDRVARFAKVGAGVAHADQQVQVAIVQADEDARLERVVYRSQHREVVAVAWPLVAIAVDLRGLAERMRVQVAKREHRAGLGDAVECVAVGVHQVGDRCRRRLQGLVLSVTQEVFGLLDEAVPGKRDPQQRQ